MSTNIARLFGVVTKILPDGETCICEPIFTNHTQKGYSKENQKFYKAVYDEHDILKTFKEIDISKYGTPIFLPASRKKILDGKEYLVMFQSSKNDTKYDARTYSGVPILATQDSGLYWMPQHITVGIKFPSKFVAILATLNKDDLFKLTNF